MKSKNKLIETQKDYINFLTGTIIKRLEEKVLLCCGEEVIYPSIMDAKWDQYILNISELS